MSDTHEEQADSWVGTWAGPAFGNGILTTFGNTGLADQTLRMVLPVALGGTRVRCRLSNRFGDQPLHLADATIARADADGTRRGVAVPLTFAGRTDVTVPVRGEVLSDPIDMVVADLESLVVSLFVLEPSGSPTRTRWFVDGPIELDPGAPLTLVAAGNRVHDPDEHFERVAFQGFVAAIDVATPRPAEAVVVIGDSLSLAYPRLLAERVVRHRPGLSVINASVAGNRLLAYSPCFGEAGLARFAPDALMQSGVRSVIAMWTNDIGMSHRSTADDSLVPEEFRALMPPSECFGHHDVTADSLIVGWRHLLALAHSRGVRLIGGTTPPFKGQMSHTPEKEEIRRGLNEWITGGGELDGVVDFDRALRSASDPSAVDPTLHMGDFLHPNEAGCQAMADAVDLAIL